MRFLRWLIVALLCSLPASAAQWLPLVKSSGGGGSVTLVQQKDTVNSSTTTNVVTLTTPTTSGNVLVCVVNWNAGQSVSSRVDGSGDTMTDSGLGFQFDGNAQGVTIFAFLAPTAGTTTVTTTFSGATDNRGHCYEVSGLATKAFDKVPAALTAQGTAPILTNASGVLTSANEFAAAYFTTYANAFTGTGGGFTDDGANTVPFNNQAGHIIVSATTSLTGSGTAGGAIIGMGVIATLR